MAVDSNLLLEFSPKGERSTAIEDTVAWVHSKAFPYKDKTGEAIRAMILNYSAKYGSELVVRVWESYSEQHLLELLIACKRDMAHLKFIRQVEAFASLHQE